MPCLNLSTNVNLEGVDTSSILSEATSTVATLIGKPEAVLSLSMFLYLQFLVCLNDFLSSLEFSRVCIDFVIVIDDELLVSFRGKGLLCFVS
jgi:hypothetical protein